MGLFYFKKDQVNCSWMVGKLKFYEFEEVVQEQSDQQNVSKVDKANV